MAEATFEQSYQLLDSGDERKLERFGSYTISRPCSIAIWKKTLSQEHWDNADAIFTREAQVPWKLKKHVLSQWEVSIEGIYLRVAPTDFGHLGAFPEHGKFWPWIQQKIHAANRQIRILNLFAYSGGASLAAAKSGAQVCHVDSSKGMVTWARENATINQLEQAPIRWIVDDAIAFIKRERKRQSFYDGIILDPPSFGRGNKGQVFKISEDLPELLEMCRDILSPNPLFLLLSCHTPGINGLVLHHLIDQLKLKDGNIESGRMLLESPGVYDIPSGSFARWSLGT